MNFFSILFDKMENQKSQEQCNAPGFFTDLNLDQIINEVLEDKEEYNLNAFFYQSLKDISTINYRLEVMHELENRDIHDIMDNFSNEMKRVKEYSGYSRNLHNTYQRKKWLLDAAMNYCNAVLDLYEPLKKMNLESNGLQLLKCMLAGYIKSDKFIELYSDTHRLLSEFSEIKYCLLLDRDKIEVNTDEDEIDYCSAINSTFEQLNEVTHSYEIKYFTDLEMCNLENKILEIVRKMNLGTFDKLDVYYEKHIEFPDNAIMKFYREIQFYLSYLKYIDKLRKKGFNFSYPDMSGTKRITITGGYDLALAYVHSRSGYEIIPNDLLLKDDERVCILTGPNQGGKTTFARAFGQILFLSSIGCPVPCMKAELFLFSNIFTHFSREESLETNSGRLKEELVRLRQIMEQTTPDSIIIINELFATTTTHDAYIMGKNILDYFISLDCICLYVTHIFELSQYSKEIVSLVATVNSDEGKKRTYRIVRKPADGYAYANSITEKYGLTYVQIKERIGK